jgi:hypothetical protein
MYVYDLSNDGFCFPTWDLHFYLFYAFDNINNINNINFFQLGTLVFDQSCICDDFGTSANQFSYD